MLLFFFDLMLEAALAYIVACLLLVGAAWFILGRDVPARWIVGGGIAGIVLAVSLIRSELPILTSYYGAGIGGILGGLLYHLARRIGWVD